MAKDQCRRRQVVSLEDHVSTLNRLTDREQDYKDKIHARLNSHCSLKLSTNCWLYLGSQQPDGQVKVRVGRRAHKIGRVAAWLYIEGFELWDSRYEVVHTCISLHCFNPDHLRIVRGRAEALALLNALGKMRLPEAKAPVWEMPAAA